MPNQKRGLAVRANRTNGSLDAVVADVDAAIGQDDGGGQGSDREDSVGAGHQYL